MLEKLEWYDLLSLLTDFAQTHEGMEKSSQLQPSLTLSEVERRWSLVDPLRVIAAQGYKAPIGELLPMSGIFRAAKLGQILDGPTLRAVYDLLESVRRVYGFAQDLAAKCSTLARVRGQILPLPHLAQAIGRAVGPGGELRDDASPELTRLRRLKVTVRQRIEESITKLLHEGELVKYLQDDFWTVRSERYVVPMRLDGRGRVKGTVLDTSDSGQTLFIEPASITPLNDQLLELDLEEKLEIARIFKQLSQMVEADRPTLEGNYEQLVTLDLQTAEALLAVDIQAGVVTLWDTPILDLVDARHPLLKRSGGRPPVGNSVSLKSGQHGLVISGPNAGGKTVVLKTVGLLHVMAKAGLLIPADASSKIFLFERLWLEMGDAQNLAASLSTFSGHLHGLKPILERAQARDLALLDELAVGTDPETGAAIGAAILERLADQAVTTLVSTHFDSLKSLAFRDTRFRNGSMEFSLTDLRPTYRLILDVPGQSFGLEVAEQIGLPKAVLDRAKELRHGQTSPLDQAVTELMAGRDQARAEAAALHQERLSAQGEKARWEQEVALLHEQRQKVSKDLTQRFESQFADLRREFDETVKKLRQNLKESEREGPRDQDLGRTPLDLKEAMIRGRQEGEKALKGMDQLVSQLSQSYSGAEKLPGQPTGQSALNEGTPVYVLPLKKAGVVIRTGDDETVEVKVGVIKLRVSRHDLRLLSEGELPKGEVASRKTGGRPNQGSRPKARAPEAPRGGDDLEIGFTMPSATNTVDLRGQDLDRALSTLWDFVDRAMLRGEEGIVVIHGHGEGTLKAGVRSALRQNCPYDLRFRPGQNAEGGDGVTVIRLKG